MTLKTSLVLRVGVLRGPRIRPHSRQGVAYSGIWEQLKGKEPRSTSRKDGSCVCVGNKQRYRSVRRRKDTVRKYFVSKWHRHVSVQMG